MTTGSPFHSPSDDAIPTVHSLTLPPLTEGASDAARLLETAPVNPLHQDRKSVV